MEAKYCSKWRCETRLGKSKHRSIEIARNQNIDRSRLRDYDRKSIIVHQNKNKKNQNMISTNFSLYILKEISLERQLDHTKDEYKPQSKIMLIKRIVNFEILGDSILKENIFDGKTDQ